MQAWLARLLARLIATLDRLHARLQPSALDPDAPPPHWVAHVAKRAPHLVAGGRVHATFASANAADTMEPRSMPPASAYGPAPIAPLPPRRMAAVPAPANAPPRPSPWPNSPPPAFAPAGAAAATPPSSTPPISPPMLDIDRGPGPTSWPELDAARTTSVPFAGPPEADDHGPSGWPELPPWPDLPTWSEPHGEVPNDVDPLFESELRRLERSLREMEGLPWIG